MDAICTDLGKHEAGTALGARTCGARRDGSSLPFTAFSDKNSDAKETNKHALIKRTHESRI
jgi:hypothetical protein